MLATGPSEVGARRFDFSADYEVINELGQALFERAKQERGPSVEAGAGSSCSGPPRSSSGRSSSTRKTSPRTTCSASSTTSSATTRRAADHAALHARYKPDDNARDRAIATHRLANAAANHAAQSIVIYPLR